MQRSIIFPARLTARQAAATTVNSIRWSSSGAKQAEGGESQIVKGKPGLFTDPYPLPLQHPLSTSDDTLSSTPHPTETVGSVNPNEDIDTLRARLLYQTRKRGTLETGLLFSSWATKDRLSTMPKEELQSLDRLLTIPEWTLYYWAIDKKQPPEDSEWHNSPLLAAIRKHCRNEEKQRRVMPELPHDN